MVCGTATDGVGDFAAPFGKPFHSSERYREAEVGVAEPGRCEGVAGRAGEPLALAPVDTDRAADEPAPAEEAGVAASAEVVMGVNGRGEAVEAKGCWGEEDEAEAEAEEEWAREVIGPSAEVEPQA